MVGLLKLFKGIRSAYPRHTHEQQGLEHLGLQRLDFRDSGGGSPIMQLRPIPNEEGSYKTDLSVNFERDIGGFVYFIA